MPLNTRKNGNKQVIGCLGYISAIPFLVVLIIFSTLILLTPKLNPPKFLIKDNKTASINTASSKLPLYKFESIPEPSFLLAAHAATLEVLPNGDLIALWFAGSHEGKPDVKIWQSKYNGTNWEMAHYVVSPAIIAKDTNLFIKKVGNPVVYLANDGKLHLFVVSVGVGGWSGSSLNHFVSTNNGNNWGNGEKLILSPFINISTLDRTRAVTLSDGGFYLPVYHEFIRTYPELLRFDKNGKFIKQQRLNNHNNLLQPALLPMSDDNALVYMRNNTRHDNILYYQFTHDGGVNWTKPAPTNLTNQDSSLVVAMLGDTFLMVHNIAKRNKLALASSKDGINWTDFYLLENSPEGEFSYPAIQVHGDNVDILYTWERKYIKHVSFNKAWLDENIEKGSVNATP